MKTNLNTEHNLEFQVKSRRTTLRADCSCGQSFGKVTQANGGGMAYFRHGISIEFTEHLINAGVETTEAKIIAEKQAWG